MLMFVNTKSKVVMMTGGQLVLHIIGSYMTLVVAFLTIFAAWRFGNWRDWRKYYPTILFTVIVNFLITILTYNHSLWHFEKTLFIPNHVLADIFMKFLNYPAIVLLYLSRYPYNSRLPRQLTYLISWVVVFSLIEWMFVCTKITTYHNGWNIWWSIVVWVFMFIGFRIHHTRPLWAWLLCFVGTAFLIFYFHLPITKLK